MISIILTAWKEPKSAERAARLLVRDASQLVGGSEFILICPDDETREAVRNAVHEEGYEPAIFLTDPGKGKPYALNMACRRAKGEIIVSTDGDVAIEQGAITKLLEPLSDPAVGGVSGRPVCRNDRKTLWGYWGHLFMDAAHQKRSEMSRKGLSYAMSGYLLAFRNMPVDISEGMLDDVYFSNEVVSRGLRIAYAPEARVFVLQPGNLREWLDQKVRSIAGYQHGVRLRMKNPSERSFRNDLAYVFFPLKYAKGVKELAWSLLQYPVRLYTWGLVWWHTKVRKRSAAGLWKRVVSTHEG
ncbi:MAG: glycosyltransferase [Candidatus Dojkabacteria bacterium]|nr:glycosyltransferase [Candidatus Dojkabacteria bacterium]